MIFRTIAASVVALSLSIVPVTRAAADVGDFVAGAIIGGIVGNAAKNNQRKKSTRTYVAKPRLPSTQEGRQIQSSLNYFGFNAGAVDGQLGGRSRNAISSYQAYLGYPATGQLTPYEQNLLISAYSRAQADPVTASQVIASTGQGSRGLLIVYRDELAGGTRAVVGNTYGLPREVAASVNEIARSSDPSAQQLVQRSGFIQLADINGDGQTDYVIDTSVTGSAFWCNAQSCAVRVFASTPEGYERNDFQAFNVTPTMFSCQRGNCTQTADTGSVMAAAPAQTGSTLPPVQSASAATLPVPTAIPASPSVAVAAPAPSVLPNFLGGNSVGQSLTSHCNTVSLLTNTNGGFTTTASMTDPSVALNEQFCLARTYAIAKSEDMIAKVQGFTSDQITAQCKQFGPAMQPHVAALALKSQPDVVRDVAGFILTTGMSPAQLTGTAEICMGVGYRTDDMDVALGSALMLYAMGSHVYGELMGHHLAQGFGTSKRIDAARVWYAEGLKAVDAGAPAVFAPGQPERTELLRKASLSLGTSNSGLAPVQPTVQPASLPTFGLISE